MSGGIAMNPLRPLTQGVALWAGEENARGASKGDVLVPAAFTFFPGELWRAPRTWVEKTFKNLIYFHEVDKGGHFAAWEQPQLFAEEVRAAFRSLR
jgi:pimeloyl-ACP methyl ester carboxylesterase